MIPNLMFAFDTKYFCNNDEKLVYAELWFSQQIGNINNENKTTITTLDLLTFTLGWETPTRESRGRTRIANALNSLKEKGYVYFQETLTHSDRNGIQIVVLGQDYETEVTVDVSWSQSNRTFKGFSRVTSVEYNQLKENHDLTLFLYSKWRENIGYKISYVEWGKALGVNDRHARRIVENTSVIQKVQGAFNKETGKNETNSYKAEISDNKDKNKTITKKIEKPEVEEAVEIVKTELTADEVAQLNAVFAQEKRQSEFKRKGKVLPKIKVDGADEFFNFINQSKVNDKQLVQEKVEQQEEKTDIFTSMFSELDKPNKILESEMKKITDENVKGNFELLKKIQDKSVRLDYDTYKIIKESKDFKVKELGNEKIKSISQNEYGLKKMISFEQKWREEFKNRRMLQTN